MLQTASVGVVTMLCVKYQLQIVGGLKQQFYWQCRLRNQEPTLLKGLITCLSAGMQWNTVENSITRARTHTHTHTHTHTRTHTHTVLTASLLAGLSLSLRSFSSFPSYWFFYVDIQRLILKDTSKSRPVAFLFSTVNCRYL